MKHLSRKLANFLLLILMFNLACSLSPNNGIQLRQHSEEMQSEVSRFIFVGMPILKAKKILEKSNFSCENHKNGIFSLQKRDRNEQKVSDVIVKGDFLSCSINHSYFIASKSWQIYILHEANKVVLVYAVINHQNL